MSSPSLKYTMLKKKAIIHVSVAVAVLAVLGGGTFFLISQQGDVDRESRNVQRNVRSLANQVADLELTNERVHTSLVRFKEINDQFIAGKLSLNEKYTEKLLNTLRKSYYINNLKLNMTREEKLSDQEYNLKTLHTNFREFTLEFDTLSDRHVFAFIMALKEVIPGYLHVKDLRIDRQRMINNAALLDIADGNTPRLVNASISFVWLGISLNKKDEPEDGEAR